MKISGLYKIFPVSLPVFISCVYCYANEIEAKFKIFGLNKAQKQNRKILSDVMKQAGFIPMSYEWWHFNGMSKETARKEFEIIE